MRIVQTGLLIHDPAKATPGYTLIAPYNQKQVYLVDLTGETVHQWELQEINGCLAQLLENGNLMVTEESMEGCPIPFGRGGKIREYDWDGNLVWEYIDTVQHHDARRLANGNTLYLGWESMPEDLAARVQGGQPGSEHPVGGIWSDYLREVTPSGETAWEWHFWDEEIERYPLPPMSRRHEFAHTNACFEMANGDILVSIHSLNMIAIIDKTTARIRWTASDPTWGLQHDAQMLENGNIMLFANGFFAPGLPSSRVLELDAEAKEIIWQFRSNRVLEFFSPIISGCQRLAGGNTLICEGTWGRVFEVTPAGEIVWEFISPHETEREIYAPPAVTMNWLYRAYRYSGDSPQIQNRV